MECLLSLLLSNSPSELIRALMDTISELQGPNKLAPITVIVPSFRTGSLLSLELVRYCGSLGNVTFKTAMQIARELVDSRYNSSPKRISNLIFSSFLATAINENRTTNPIFVKNSSVPIQMSSEVESHLLSQFTTAISELATLEAESIHNLADFGHSEKFLFEVYSFTRNLMNKWNFVLEADYFFLARKVLGQLEFDVSDFGIGDVVLFAPHALIKSASQMFGDLSLRTRVVLINVATGSDSIDRAFEDRMDLLAQNHYKSISKRQVSMHGRLGDVSLVSTPDRDIEVDVTIALILEALKEGVAPEAICVYYTSEQMYLSRILQGALRARIPVLHADVSSQNINKAFSIFRAIYAFYLSGTRADFVDLVSKGGLFFPKVGLNATEVERFTIDYKLSGDLFTFAERYLMGLDRATPGDRYHNKFNVELLVKFILELKSKCQILESAVINGSWSDVAQASIGVLSTCFDLPSAPNMNSLYSGPNDSKSREIQDLGVTQLMGAVESLCELDQFEQTPSMATFWSFLQSQAAFSNGQSGRVLRGIRVTSIFSFDPIPSKRAFVIGMSDELFFRQGGSKLISENVRKELGLLTIGDRNALEMRALLVQIQLSDKVVLVVPRSDVSKPGFLYPAPIISTIENLVATSKRILKKEQILSRSEFLERCSDPIDLRNLGARNLYFGGADSFEVEDPAGKAGTDPIKVVVRMTTFPNGYLSMTSRIDEMLATLSPTAIETWLACPYKFLLSNLLRIKELEAPEVSLRLDPLTRGTLLHLIFERLVRSREDTDSSGELEKNFVNEVITQAWTEVVGLQTCRSKAKNFWLLSDLRKISREVFRFVEMERDYSLVPKIEQLEKEIAADMTLFNDVFGNAMVRLNAKLDRISTDNIDTIRVIDYKTGKYQYFFENGSLHWSKVQLALYRMLVMNHYECNSPSSHPKDVLSTYWFISETGGYQIYDLTPSQIAQGEQNAALAVIAMRKGVFFAGMHHTSSFSKCAFCDPGIGGQDSARASFLKAFKSSQITLDLKHAIGEADEWSNLFAGLDALGSSHDN